MSDPAHHRRQGADKQARGRRRKTKAQWLRSRNLHDYVFDRERHTCRCCLRRSAQSMHELLFRSVGGKRSANNSIAVCGDGTRGCHGFLQRHEITWGGTEDGAEAMLVFTVNSAAAARWLRRPLGQTFRSPRLPFFVMDGA
jgi:hypothetical protein